VELLPSHLSFPVFLCYFTQPPCLSLEIIYSVSILCCFCHMLISCANKNGAGAWLVATRRVTEANQVSKQPVRAQGPLKYATLPLPVLCFSAIQYRCWCYISRCRGSASFAPESWVWVMQVCPFRGSALGF